MYIVWPALFIVLIIIEIETLQLVSVWFAAGALASTIVVLCNGPLWLQFTVFLVVSTALLIASRPIVKKALKMGTQPTNAELDIGKSATVIEDINNSASTGRVTLNGVDWAAVSKDGSKISKDSIVIVNAVEGAKLIVSLKDSED
ncbi:MAG: NfeD family protein [Oscillospiraceae bacterium]|nr:NfeD family protein [Oscillospiraceae bacterium]